MSKRALLLIDLQKDYFQDGLFPLWNTEATLTKIRSVIKKSQAAGDLIVHIQHIADPAMGLAPFFNEGTKGAEIHPEILAAAPEAPIIIKHYADSFVDTGLKKLLQANGVNELLVCGMMTQNCVTHTAISKQAEDYQCAILVDCCTTVSEMLHQIALHAVSTRIQLVDSNQVFDQSS